MLTLRLCLLLTILRQLIQTSTRSSKYLRLPVVLLLGLASILIVTIHTLSQLTSVVLGVVWSHHLRDVVAAVRRVAVLG